MELHNQCTDSGAIMKEDIFDKACDAFEAGKGRDTNPFDKFSQYEQWYEWDIGWELSEEEANLRLNE